LKESGYKYVITGAMAASYYGRLRTTRDVDFKVQVRAGELDNFLDKLQNGGLRVDRRSIKNQLDAGYNVVSLEDTRSHYRADFIVETGPIRRRRGSALGLDTYYDPPENLVLAKLRMIKATVSKEKSHKDREDISEILRNTRINRPRLFRLAKEQGTKEILKQIL